MLKKILLVALASLISISANAEKISQKEPYQLIKDVSTETFNRLKAEQPQIQKDPNHLKVIVKEELMPYVNHQYAALKVLGSQLKGAKKEEVGEFIDAFQDYLTTNYAIVLTQYTSQELEYEPVKTIDKDSRITTVGVNIVETGKPNIDLKFKLRKSKSDDWSAFDLEAEGISMLSSKTTEWSPIIRKDGILKAAEEMKKQAKKDIVIK